MNRNKDVLNNLYENLRLVCYQLPHFISDFDNEFLIKTEPDKQIFEAISESVKTNLADAYITSELIFNIINAEDDTEILSFIEAEQSEA